jgi:hypothetical protein
MKKIHIFILAIILFGIGVAYITYSEDKVIYNEIKEFNKQTMTPIKYISDNYDFYKEKYKLEDFDCKNPIFKPNQINDLDFDIKNTYKLSEENLIKWKEAHPKSVDLLKLIYQSNLNLNKNLQKCVNNKDNEEIESLALIINNLNSETNDKVKLFNNGEKLECIDFRNNEKIIVNNKDFEFLSIENNVNYFKNDKKALNLIFCNKK